MPTTAHAGTSLGETFEFALSPQQETFFRTFGFLKLPGLFAKESELIQAGFEEVFAAEKNPFVLDPKNEYHCTRDPAYRNNPRQIIPSIIDKSDKLRWIRDDRRIRAIAGALLGEGYEYAESDGNLFNCDVYWHIDSYGAPVDIRHIKIYFYLDRLRPESGALRVIPGSQHAGGAYAWRLRGNLHQPARVKEIYGVDLDEIPSWKLDSEPGDIIVGDLRTFHASFGGAPRRRLFTVNFREKQPAGA